MDQRPFLEGNRGTKTILGNREHTRKQFFDFGQQGNTLIYFRETREQASLLGGPRSHCLVMIVQKYQ